jgi:hypothetical protein
VWTGPDGITSSTVEQIGSQGACAGATAECYGWYELYPSALVAFSQVVKAGDQLGAAVGYAGSTFMLTLKNVTEGWSQSVHKALRRQAVLGRDHRGGPGQLYLRDAADAGRGHR